MTDMAKIKVADWFKDDLEALQTDPEFLAEDVILDVMEQIHVAMNDKGVTQADLARHLATIRGKDKVSRSAISQLLSGDQNISIKRLVEVALALGMTITPPQLVPLQVAEVEAVEGDTLPIATLDAPMMSYEYARSLWEMTATWDRQISAKKSLDVPEETEAANDYTYSLEMAA